jgi:phospholipid/cholesterol/gamma-HCH transport system substrate-binding protein
MEDRRTSAIVGAVALVVILAFLVLLFQYLSGNFKSGTEVEATFARAGQLLSGGGDVKMRGVLVGEVRAVDVAPTGEARVRLLLDGSQEIPSNINAAIRAKTLFGEKFVDLIPPKVPSGERIADGAKIPLERTIPPIEVETILEKGVPLLEAIDPEAFAGGLHAIAVGLVGNEDSLRRANVQSLELLTETERTLPNLERNLVHLQRFASAVDQADTDLLNALDGLTRVGEAIREHPDEFHALLASLVPLADDLGDVITNREADLKVLASEQRAILEEVRQRKDKLPGIVRVLDGFLGVWVADLSEGPYWRISVTDPPILTGEPYGAGEAPSPRTAAIASLRKEGTALDDILGILLAPVPDEDITETADQLAPLLGALR